MKKRRNYQKKSDLFVHRFLFYCVYKCGLYATIKINYYCCSSIQK